VEFKPNAPINVMIDGEVATLEVCSLDILPAAVDVYI
jgi:diacylglycerol kinase family enzyme